MPILSAVNLRTHFHTRHGVVRAVDGVSLSVEQNEIVGIVGESGCGKTVLCQSIMGLIPVPPAHVSYDKMSLDGEPLHTADERAMRAIRGNHMTMIFQDPMTALNPYMRISDQIAEPLRIHRGTRRADALPKALDALKAVGIPQPESRIRQYPHEFSGGMRQRVCIAMALITEPKLLFADEPTTALDVTVQAQILALLKELQARYGVAIVFVTHDFGVVAGLCDRVMVMYAGKVVESAPTAALFARPEHPYTEALLRALPARAARGQGLRTIAGQPPDLARQIDGCAFAPRCEYATPECTSVEMKLSACGSGHTTACLRMQKGEIGELGNRGAE